MFIFLFLMVVWNRIKKIIILVSVKNDDFFNACFIDIEIFRYVNFLQNNIKSLKKNASKDDF
jgi:hypothetical protein